MPLRPMPRQSKPRRSEAATTVEKPSDAQEYYNTKRLLFDALIEIIDVSQLTKMDAPRARQEVSDVVREIVTIKKIVMSGADQTALVEDICNDVLGYGPLEPLLARDDIADIMVNGTKRIFIEVGGKVQQTDIRFHDNGQLINVCQRIVGQVGRRVDESSPICDARLADGSRVNVIVGPLAIDGAALTIRKFKKDKLTSISSSSSARSRRGATILKIIGRVRCNVVISGGTGSGKTTLLNCLTNYIDADERLITCETRPAAPSRSTQCVWRPARRISRVKAKSPCATWFATAAHAARTHHRRRGARRGLRPSAGHEHRT